MYKFYTQEEKNQILAMHKDGASVDEIAEMFGRTPKAIKLLLNKSGQSTRPLYVAGVKVAEVPESSIETEEKVVAPATDVKTKELTPREMIKKLYDLGYRIEDNKLVCYVKQVVKLNDIING